MDAIANKIGYARVSTVDQDLELQVAALKAGRLQHHTVREAERNVDYRTRGASLFVGFRPLLRSKGTTLKATEQPTDTSTATGNSFLDILGVFAEFETNLRRERQMEGISAAKTRGVYNGRPATIEVSKVAALKTQGLGATKIAKRLGVGRASVCRVLEGKKFTRSLI